MKQQIMDMAQAEFNRAVMNNLGIYMIAEAWGIEPRQVAANVRQLRRKARTNVGVMGDIGKRKVGVR